MMCAVVHKSQTQCAKGIISHNVLTVGVPYLILNYVSLVGAVVLFFALTCNLQHTSFISHLLLKLVTSYDRPTAGMKSLSLCTAAHIIGAVINDITISPLLSPGVGEEDFSTCLCKVHRCFLR